MSGKPSPDTQPDEMIGQIGEHDRREGEGHPQAQLENGRDRYQQQEQGRHQQHAGWPACPKGVGVPLAR